ncbi:MAG: hypothetical protein ABIU97_01250 [Dehalococcoidia bacterium]
MVIVFRLAYAVAVAIFFMLLVIFGQRTFISEPDYPLAAPFARGPDDLYCSESGCSRQGIELDKADDDKLSEADLKYVQAFRTYRDDGEDYFRNVFVISALLGVTAIAAGVYLFRRVEALPLGLVLGGIGVALYGWVESSRGEGEMEEIYAFIVATIGFVVLATGGYWFLGGREQRTSLPEPDPPPQPER